MSESRNMADVLRQWQEAKGEGGNDMCIHRGECPHADMTCSTVTFCPLADDEVYVGPVQGQSKDELCNSINEERYGNPCSDYW